MSLDEVPPCTECGEDPAVRPFVCSRCGSAICSICVIAAVGLGLESTAFPCPKCDGQPSESGGELLEALGLDSQGREKRR